MSEGLQHLNHLQIPGPFTSNVLRGVVAPTIVAGLLYDLIQGMIFKFCIEPVGEPLAVPRFARSRVTDCGVPVDREQQEGARS